MRFFGSVPRALGFKRKPSPDLAVLLDVLNEDEPHVYGFDAWDQIVADLKADLLSIQGLQFEARDGFDEATAGGVDMPLAEGSRQPRRDPPFEYVEIPAGSLRLRWEPPFDPPPSLAGHFRAQQDYFYARRGLWALWQSDAAHLVHECFNAQCAERPYVFARETCRDLRCLVGALRHARKYESFRLDAERRMRVDDRELTEDDLSELPEDPLFRKRV